MAEPDRLHLGEPVTVTGAAPKDRELIADKPATTAGEDGWPIDQIRPVLLAAAGG